MNSKNHTNNQILKLLASVTIACEANFALILKMLLDKHTINDLHEYLDQQNYEIEKTSLYKYFNPKKQTNRLPSEKQFLELLADFLKMSSTEAEGLVLLWAIQKRIIRSKKDIL